MRYSVQFTNRCLFVGFVTYPYVYTSTGLSAGLNLSLAMIQEDYGAYVAASVG
jgi:transcriptional regulator GlxA family with amidase domain